MINRSVPASTAWSKLGGIYSTHSKHVHRKRIGSYWNYNMEIPNWAYSDYLQPLDLWMCRYHEGSDRYACTHCTSLSLPIHQGTMATNTGFQVLRIEKMALDNRDSRQGWTRNETKTWGGGRAARAILFQLGAFRSHSAHVRRALTISGVLQPQRPSASRFRISLLMTNRNFLLFLI